MCYMLIPLCQLASPAVSEAGVIASYSTGRRNWGRTALFSSHSLPLAGRGKGVLHFSFSINLDSMNSHHKLRLNWACETDTFPKVGIMTASALEHLRYQGRENQS